MERIAIARRSARVERLLREDAGDDAGVLATPLTALLNGKAYSRELAQELETLARAPKVMWPVRRIATLMFEALLARIPADDVREHRYWLHRLGIADLLELAREGYVSGEPLEEQVWRRLARLGRIHRLTLTGRTNDRALRDFLHAARTECRLTFARRLWGVDEIIRRIEH